MPYQHCSRLVSIHSSTAGRRRCAVRCCCMFAVLSPFCCRALPPLGDHQNCHCTTAAQPINRAVSLLPGTAVRTTTWCCCDMHTAEAAASIPKLPTSPDEGCPASWAAMLGMHAAQVMHLPATAAIATTAAAITMPTMAPAESALERPDCAAPLQISTPFICTNTGSLFKGANLARRVRSIPGDAW